MYILIYLVESLSVGDYKVGIVMIENGYVVIDLVFVYDGKYIELDVFYEFRLRLSDENLIVDWIGYIVLV